MSSTPAPERGLDNQKLTSREPNIAVSGGGLLTQEGCHFPVCMMWARRNVRACTSAHTTSAPSIRNRPRSLGSLDMKGMTIQHATIFHHTMPPTGQTACHVAPLPFCLVTGQHIPSHLLPRVSGSQHWRRESVWRHKVSMVGQQALERADGAEESQGRKALGIHRPSVHSAHAYKMLPETKLSNVLGLASDLENTSHKSVARALLKVRLT